jgi:hypothetical protein
MKAIETSYKGNKFKSRLEYRWAYFFDQIDASWYYEFQGYALDCYWYLPDFYIPKWKCYFEAKDPSLWLNFENKYREFRSAFWKCALLSRATQHKTILCFGGFGSNKADPMCVFMPGYNKNTFRVITGEGLFGKCNGTDVLFLEGYYPGSEIVDQVRSMFLDAGSSPDFVSWFFTSIGFEHRRTYLIPLHGSIGFNFTMIKENDYKVFAPFSDPLLCSFNAPYFNKFKPHTEAYSAARQVMYGDKDD